jgi:hypothetical protein
MMKNCQNINNEKPNLIRSALCILANVLVLCFVTLVVSGCKSLDQPGETRAEVDRRHERVLRLNQQGMLSDIDKTLMLDRPSNLTDKRIP